MVTPLRRQLEYTARLDFLWRVQAKEEINEMKELREHNENMLRNILPSHVARHFLEKDRDNEVSPRHGDTPSVCSWFAASQLVFYTSLLKQLQLR